MAKTKNDLKKSRQKRKEMMCCFGFMPHSILKIKRGTKNFYNYQLETNSSTNKNILANNYDFCSPFFVSGKGSRGGERFSIMPFGLVEFMIKYYSKPDDLYCDPFAGQGVRMQVAKSFNIDYIGYDICEKFICFIKSVKEKIDDKTSKLEIYKKDSRKIDNEAKNWTFCFTSPPYWDLEKYGNEQEQLGINHTYEEFLENITDVYKAMYRQAKNNAIIIININDFRKNGKFYSYHADTISCLEKAGFVIHDIGIIEGCVTGIAKAFAYSFNKKKILPKIHEYIIVAKALKEIGDFKD